MSERKMVVLITGASRGIGAATARIADSDPAEWAKNVNVNLVAPFYLARYALPHLRAHRGRIVNVSTGAAVRAVQGWSAYCAAKAGLNATTAAHTARAAARPPNAALACLATHYQLALFLYI